MVVDSVNDPDAGGPPPADLFAYAEAMGRELAGLCEEAGAKRAASFFREAAQALIQLADAKAAPGDAAEPPGVEATRP